MIYEILNQNNEVINTIVADEAFMLANFPQGNYRLVEEAPAPPPPEPEWAWYIDHGPMTDRLGPSSALIDISTVPGVVAVRADFARRKWIDLKDARVAAALRYLAGEAHPVLGTLETPILTLAVVNTALTTPVADHENRALRKVYFS